MSLTILACRILRGAVVLYLVPFYWRSIPSNITDFKVSVILHTYSVLLAKKYVSIYKSVHMFCVHFSVNIYSIVTVHPNFFQTLQMSRSDTYVHIWVTPWCMCVRHAHIQHLQKKMWRHFLHPNDSLTLETSAKHRTSYKSPASTPIYVHMQWVSKHLRIALKRCWTYICGEKMNQKDDWGEAYDYMARRTWRKCKRICTSPLQSAEIGRIKFYSILHTTPPSLLPNPGTTAGFLLLPHIMILLSFQCKL